MSLRLPAALAIGLLAFAGCQRDQQPDETAADVDPRPTVVLETTRGRIVMELDREKAPVTVNNFLRHVRGGFYNGLIFHRVIADFMVQAGQLTTDLDSRRSTATPINNEANNGLSNQRGTVAMARPREPHGAVAQFFINLKHNPNLDFRDSTVEGWGYAVFGKVIEGMDVVDSIAAGQTRIWGRHRNLPTEPVVIERAYIRTEEPQGL
jgi:peptidyl-prolyl cis-trans isomerase B (cyclophilin B)